MTVAVRDEFKVHSMAAGKRRRTTRPSRIQNHSTVVVNRKVWRKAMELADGDFRRIEVVGPETVVVHNKSVCVAGRKK